MKKLIKCQKILKELLQKENIDNINKQNKIQEEEDKDKRSYKSLFKLAQYLYYYRCKVEENNITININSNADNKKSNISKFNKNQGNNQKHKKSLSKVGIIDKNEENISINVLKGKDLTYLWYMEMKKKNNNENLNQPLNDNNNLPNWTDDIPNQDNNMNNENINGNDSNKNNLNDNLNNNNVNNDLNNQENPKNIPSKKKKYHLQKKS